MYPQYPCYIAVGKALDVPQHQYLLVIVGQCVELLFHYAKGVPGDDVVLGGLAFVGNGNLELVPPSDRLRPTDGNRSLFFGSSCNSSP